MSTELSALRAADFHWTSRLDEAWQQAPFHIPALQAAAGRELLSKLTQFEPIPNGAPPLGVAVLGPAGSGKSHLLSVLRRTAHDRAYFFLLIDLTDVANFEATLVLGTLRSLCQLDLGGQPQWRALLDQLFAQYADVALRGEGVDALCGSRPPGLITRCDRLIEAISKQHAHDRRLSTDTLRALLLFCSNHEDVANLGEAWLAGIGIGAEDAELHGFGQAREQPSTIFRGLMWLLSLVRPTLLALDEIDAVVAEYDAPSTRLTEEGAPDSRQSGAPSAVGLSAGIARLLDMSSRAQVVVACREETWTLLDRRSPVSLQGRFEAPVLLRPLTDATVLRSLVAVRLQQVYRAAGFTPPYP
ncbi:MAG TPA: AAA family ATPase, partial [Polyangiaceae bacterium]|nr:AAA family ATPase [Polyangiaceae bacterium]